MMTNTLQKLIFIGLLFIYIKTYGGSNVENYERRIWILSIGNNDYGSMQLRNSESDAQSFADFFDKGKANDDTSRRKFVLLGKAATRDSILACLQFISSHAMRDDYFVFYFGGVSALKIDTIANETKYFFYTANANFANIELGERENSKNMISLSALQQYAELIPADNQLFVTEAGNSENFKNIFIQGLLKNFSVAGILNKNRVVIVPNGMGFDETRCKNDTTTIPKGPLVFYLTSLDSNYNIYDLFGAKKKEIVYQLKKKEFTCDITWIGGEYFDVFFQKDYLRELSAFTSDESKKRGADIVNEEMPEAKKYAKNKYAMVVGTNDYMANGWDHLENPMFDANCVARELDTIYGFKVKLLLNPSMDSIYEALSKYYKILDATDEFFVYFAGHGDYENIFFNEGFLVCHDSKSLNEDPYRNTYLPFSKLSNMIDNMPAKQVMVVLDVCHGGAWDKKLLVKRDKHDEDDKNELKLSVENRLSLWSRYKTRIMLSSVGNKAAYEGVAGNHSPFARYFLNCLESRGENADGILTNTNINALLESKSTHSEGSIIFIEPHMDYFGSSDQEGKFVFIPKATKKEKQKPSNE